MAQTRYNATCMVSLLNTPVRQRQASPWELGTPNDLPGAGNMAQTQSNAVYMFSKPTVPISSPSDSTPAPGSGEHHLISQELASWQKNKIQREPYHRVGYEWTAQRPQEQSNDYLDATCMVRLLNIPISATTASPWGWEHQMIP
ncbi:hypothetical protein N7453_001425 [Penicillium expansum]|nr:hypothetical protein N7453_001425 [Penicillium expansum]